MNYFNKNFQALITDFDGTLVDSAFTLSPSIKGAIAKFIAKGNIFSVATGRCYQGIVKKNCRELNLTAPQIVSGGAEIINPVTNELLWHEYMSYESVSKIIKYFLGKNLHFAVESQGYVYTSSRLTLKQYGPGIIFKDIKQLDYESVPKIVLDKVGIANLQQEENKLAALYPNLHVVRSGMVGSPVLDITSAKATKYLAILQLSKILNIDPQFMIGVGDGYNDYPLLAACGLKAAMANAPQELKEIADIILPDVAHDGLAILVNNLLS